MSCGNCNKCNNNIDYFMAAIDAFEWIIESDLNQCRKEIHGKAPIKIECFSEVEHYFYEYERFGILQSGIRDEVFFITFSGEKVVLDVDEVFCRFGYDLIHRHNLERVSDFEQLIAAMRLTTLSLLRSTHLIKKPTKVIEE